MGEEQSSQGPRAAETGFVELIQRVRSGDEQAAAALVRRYEPHIRRVVRVQMTDPALRRTLDSVDICQSVLANFFVRAALGEFDLDRPEQLIRLLSVMARNRIRKHVEIQHAGRRDVRRLESAPVEQFDCADGAETPSSIVANRELLERSRAQLDEQERYLADQRALGRSWPDLADELGVSSDALRMRLSRSIDRVARKLGIGEA